MPIFFSSDNYKEGKSDRGQKKLKLVNGAHTVLTSLSKPFRRRERGEKEESRKKRK